MTLQKFFYRNGWQYLERLRLSPQKVELSRHTADPHAGPYERALTVSNALLWVNGPEEVTRIE